MKTLDTVLKSLQRLQLQSRLTGSDRATIVECCEILRENMDSRQIACISAERDDLKEQLEKAKERIAYFEFAAGALALDPIKERDRHRMGHCCWCGEVDSAFIHASGNVNGHTFCEY